jgi:hypothetical protein
MVLLVASAIVSLAVLRGNDRHPHGRRRAPSARLRSPDLLRRLGRDPTTGEGAATSLDFEAEYAHFCHGTQ